MIVHDMEAIGRVYDTIRDGGRVITDSREVREGDLFVALKGENHNGNHYVGQALQQGACFAIVDEAAAVLDERCLLLPDALVFLQRLAWFHRRRLAIPILAITGTNGKTTTKELCHAVLSRKFRTTATKGNFNNHIGVPLTLLSMDSSTEFGIVEMGANHPGEIKALCQIAEPNYGIITNVGYAHLEGFGSYENIARTKGELYDYIIQHDGTLFINNPDSVLDRLAGEYPRVTYGRTGCFANGKPLQAAPYLVCDLDTTKGHLYIKTKLVGGYNFDNVMAASAVGLHFQIDPLEIQAAIEAYTPSNLRSQWLQTKNNTILLDAYNANPSSMQVALDNFAAMKGENKLLIIGEMLELGASSLQAHADLLEKIEQLNLTSVFLIGQSFAPWINKYTFATYFDHTDKLIDYLKQHKIHSSLILVKGSRGNRLERIIDEL